MGITFVRRFLIREATIAEFDDLREFYERNPDEHVMFRHDDAVKKAISDGIFLIAIDTSLEDGDRIFGASAVYTVNAQRDSGGTIVLKEAGGSNVKKDYRGFGVHKVFHWARSLHKFILDRGGFEVYFGAIICPNDPSEANIAKAHFLPWDDPPSSLVTERQAYADPENGQSVKFYRLPKEALVEHAKQLLMQDKREILERRVNDTVEQVETHLMLETLRSYRRIVENLSQGDLGALD
ncbi:hypothetical protein QO010_004362 [Caulobacter ginsengisoli]|uniref:GNAT family N-acetyltransferase n=1 Tax=Caulobacter ginsengisoli TaxID=400775 RepID=A0ABU0IX36_9CAUL|nr:hypothetical protein [Caulobacter ginsengisoli]MDQ0466567.1 hypothetical protein [Caulobacter ginsengisoli]